MRVIPPLTGASPSITEAMLTATSVAEAETQWNGAATYAEGDERRGTGDYSHRMFRSLQGANLNHAVDDPEWWEDIGPSNRWAMFDLLRNTGTTGASPLIVEITPGQRIDAIGYAGLVAEVVTTEVLRGGDVIYTQVEDLSTRVVTGWYDFFTAPFTYKAEFALFDLPARNNVTVRVTFERTAGAVTVGAILLNRHTWLGEPETGSDDDAENYSEVIRDEITAEASMIRRRSVPFITGRVWCPASEVPKARALRDQLNAVPAMWVGLDDTDDPYFPSQLILGFYRGFKIGLEHKQMAPIDYDIMEV